MNITIDGHLYTEIDEATLRNAVYELQREVGERSLNQLYRDIDDIMIAYRLRLVRIGWAHERVPGYQDPDYDEWHPVVSVTPDNAQACNDIIELLRDSTAIDRYQPPHEGPDDITRRRQEDGAMLGDGTVVYREETLMWVTGTIQVHMRLVEILAGDQIVIEPVDGAGSTIVSAQECVRDPNAPRLS